MKYIGRLFLYLIILWVTFTLVSVAILRFIPVTFTPLKWVSLSDNKAKDLPVKSNWVRLRSISPEMTLAVVATEDNNFLQHSGFDIDAIERALQEHKAGRRLRGASTISQQTAKNVFCFPGRTWLRKGFETWFTLWIELFWGKKRIMEVYLNVIETHPNMYGVEATANYFYGKPASDLNRYEAAMIATVLPSPKRMNIGAPSSYMTHRAKNVRSLMERIGSVDFENAPEKRDKNKRK